ncbi:unnamed protein product [Soboliphyme baturini]|uniref:Pept_C1 domain-containing protein n=1 Tax=Soboliphyme baturini TaxID=241478 RepID=A0A183J9E6_9BILA|nr:unnamed protein product [Soboliphyme baturini]
MHDTFRKLSKKQLRQMLGSRPNEAVYRAAPAEEVELLDEADIPKEFDARQQWPYCSSIRLIRSQANCGSCWAVSAASIMSDRVCIATGGSKQPYISDENILSCCKHCGKGCLGGDPFAAFKYWKQGIPNGGPYNTTNGCQPYTKCWEGCPGGTPACMGHKCIPQYPYSYNSSLYYGTPRGKYIYFHVTFMATTQVLLRIGFPQWNELNKT